MPASRKPYINLGESIVERFSDDTRYLATSNRPESELEKPYNQLEYEAMHNDPIEGWDGDLINPPPFSDDPDLPPIPDLPNPWVPPDPVELNPIPDLPPPWTLPEGGLIDGDPPGYADGLLLPVIECVAAPLCALTSVCLGYLGGVIADVRVIADEGLLVESSWFQEDANITVEFLVDESVAAHVVTVEIEDTEGNLASSTIELTCGITSTVVQVGTAVAVDELSTYYDMAIDSNGNYVVVGFDSTTANVTVMTYDITAESWSQSNVVSEPDGSWGSSGPDMKVVVDSGDNPHVFLCQTYEDTAPDPHEYFTRLMHYDGGNSWYATQILYLTKTESESLYGVAYGINAITVDSSDKFHLVIQLYDNGLVSSDTEYVTNATGSWVSHSFSSVPLQTTSQTTIIDHGNGTLTIYIFIGYRDGVNDTHCRKYTGSGSSWTDTLITGLGIRPVKGFYESGPKTVAYDSNHIYYINGTSLSYAWERGTNGVRLAGNPGLDVVRTTNGVVFVAFEGYDEVTYVASIYLMQRNASGVWLDAIVMTDSTNDEPITLVPGLDGDTAMMLYEDGVAPIS